MKMKQVIISIIMPVYNAGSYLEESISSILKQTFKAFELICVDDASTDKETLRILNLYREKSKKITVLSQKERVGAGEARNLGLKAAKGSYVMFLDADDIFDIHLLEVLYDTILGNNADLCICGYESFYLDSNGRHLSGTHMPRTHLRVTEGGFCLKDLPEDALTYWSTAPWNKLCKKDFLVDNNIYFQSLPSSNDVFFSCMAALKAKKIVYSKCGRALVSYRENLESQISARRDPVNLLRAVKLIGEILSKAGQYEYNSKKILCFLLKNSIYELQHCKDHEKNKEYYEKLTEYIRSHSEGGKFTDGYYKYCIDNIRTKPYESKWFMLVDDYDAQLESAAEKLYTILAGYNEIILWGMGKRGVAFQRFCQKYSVPIRGAADQRNQNVGEKTELGYDILGTDDVFHIADLIVASNHDVYEALAADGKGIQIIDLSEYCPL